MKKSQKHSNHHESRRPSASSYRASQLSEEEFLRNPWTTTAVTFKPGVGILAIALAHKFEDGSLGFPPHAQLPITAIDHLEGSYLAFVKGVPPDEIGMIYAACCAGDFLSALRHLAIIYCDGEPPSCGIAADTEERCRELHEALIFCGVSGNNQGS